jgi:hypothetical protein
MLWAALASTSTVPNSHASAYPRHELAKPAATLPPTSVPLHWQESIGRCIHRPSDAACSHKGEVLKNVW